MSSGRVSSILLLSLALVGCDDGREKPPPAGDDKSGPDTDVADTDTDGDTDTSVDTDTEPAPTDADGDGFGTVSEGGDDCDDADPNVHPWAEETCEDGLDTNCDGIDGRCGAWESGEMAYVTDVTFWGENAGDLAGGEVLLHDINGDGLEDALITAPSHSLHVRDGGALYVAFAPFEEGGQPLEYVETRIDGESEGLIGSIAAGDADGDGVPDLLVGGGLDRTDLYVGPIAGEMTSADSVWTVELVDKAVYFYVGSSVDITDLDGDGAGELVVGAYEAWNAEMWPVGKVFILPGSTRGRMAYGDLAASTIVTIEGLGSEDWVDHAGWLVEHADMDGDGLDDLLLGLTGCRECGGVALVRSPVAGNVSLADADARWEARGYRANPAAPEGADLDSDGLPDLVVGAPDDDTIADGAGAVYLLQGQTSGLHSFEDARTKLLGTGMYERAGRAVVTGQFEDDDGLELAMSMRPGGLESAVLTVYEIPEGTVRALDVAGTLWTADGTDWLGESLSVGSVDGASGDDLLIGASMLAYKTSEAGASYLMYGLE